MPAYKDKDRGTWYVKYSVGGKQKLKRGFATKREALAFEAKQKTASEPGSDYTFGDIAESYFKYRNQAETTQIRQQGILKNYVPITALKYADLSKAVLMDWYLDLGQNELAPVTKNLVLRIVKSIFKHGQEFYDLPNYAAGLKPFKKEKKEMQTWTPEEFAQFLEHVNLAYYRAYFSFLYWTGCRMMEGASITYRDIDGNRIHIRGTKNLTSDRWITIPDTLLEQIRPVMERCTPESPYLFGDTAPLNGSTIYYAFKNAIKRSGVKEIRVHDLRHSFATNMIASGAEIIAVSKYLGHTDITTTLRVYAHLLDTQEKNMVQKIENLMISVSK